MSNHSVSPSKNRWFWLSDFLKFLLALVLVGVLFTQTSIDVVIITLQGVSVGWLASGFLTFVALVWVMARRYWLLIGQDTSFPALLRITVVQVIVSNIVATSAGIAVYMTLLRGERNVRLSASLGSLILSRFADLLLLLPILIGSAWMTWPYIQPLHGLIIILSAGIVCIVLFITLILVFQKTLVERLDLVIYSMGLKRFALVQKLMQGIYELAGEQTAIFLRELPQLLGFSALYSLLTFALQYCSLRSFGLNLSIAELLLALTLTNLTTIIPIQIFGGLGVVEMTYTYIYGLFGIAPTVIAPILVGSRVIFIIMNIALFVVVPLSRIDLRRNLDRPTTHDV